MWGATLASAQESTGWVRHDIDTGSKGADGVRLGDLDGDGRLDVVTGWEEGGAIRVALQPDAARVRQPWSVIEIAKVRSPEDALFADLDGDGDLDVASCCEGGEKKVFVHWNPGGFDRPWETGSIPAVEGRAWMFAAAARIDGDDAIDLFVGAKGGNATVGWLRAPPSPKTLADWVYVPLIDAGWIMSLVATDVDGDGDEDLLFTDRKGKHRGVFWLERPAPDYVHDPAAWTKHAVTGHDCEVMFLDSGDLNGDGEKDLAVATRNGRILVGLRTRSVTSELPRWDWHSVHNSGGAPLGKSVRIVDLVGDDRPELLLALNTNGDRNLRGVTALRWTTAITEPTWEVVDISGPHGIKFDLLEPLDLDDDGDLDVIGCEERDGLGVFWYENPQR